MHSVLLSLFVFELTFKIVPVNPAQVLNPYNLGYNTGIPYSTSISRSQIKTELRTAHFTFTINDTSYLYKGEPSTIKEKRQKKSAPSIPSFGRDTKFCIF